VTTWVHGRHLLTEGRRMAKSAGNFAALRDVADRGHSPLAVRLLFLQARYQTPINFNWEALAGAERALERLRSRMAEWSRDRGTGSAPGCAGYEQRFWAAVQDDLDTPRALAVLAELEADESLPPGARFTSVAAFDRLLGLDLAEVAGVALPAGAEELIRRREQARAARDFATADRLREELAALGVEVTDTRAGTSWRLPRRPS
jgi:cysteinyl-tRNA synthetase